MITLTNGFPQGPNGLIVPNGSIKFQLNVDATVIAAPGGFVAADIPVVFQFDKTGALIQPAKIWSNEELQPQLSSTLLGTYYLTTFYDQNGAVLNATPLWWQFPEAINSTVDISQMTPISTVGGNVIFYPTNFAGGTGSVTSVTFTGDGTVLSSTPSPPVTTSGTVTATLLTQNANLVFAGPPTPGPAALPTFRSLAAGDVPPLRWNSLIAATANLTLANTSFTTTFTQTTPAAWIWANVTPATSSVAQSSPIITIRGQSWDGSASVNNDFTIQNIPTNGTNAGQTLAITSILSNGGVTFGTSPLTAGQINTGAIFASADITLTASPATSGGNHSSVNFKLNSAWWDGSISETSVTSIQDVEGSGTNPTDTTTISNSGAFAWAGVSVVGALKAQTLNITAAAASTTAGQLQIGNAIATLTGSPGSGVTTNSTASPGPASTTAVAGYIKMFIGTQAIWVAYFE